MAMTFLQALAQAGMVPRTEDTTTQDMTVTAGLQTEDAGLPTQSIAQPEYLHNLPGSDPAAVDPNNPAFLDRRVMDFNAQELQRQASAAAAGGKYQPRFQDDVKNFKSHPGLQFGTTGTMRDIIGNATDFLGSLVGRRPTYAREKWQDAIYGWDQPGQFEAAISRGMQYDPAMTQEFLKNITSVRQAEASTDSISEDRNARAQQRRLQAVTGLASGISSAPNPAAAYASGGRVALQRQLDSVYGEGTYTLPEEYDANQVESLVNAGYRGQEVSRERIADINNEVKERIAQMGIASKEALNAVDNATRLKVAQIAANASMSNTEKRLAADRAIEEYRASQGYGGYGPIVTGENPFTGDRSFGTRSSVMQNSAPVPGARRGQDGRWYTRGPNGQAVPVGQ